MEVQHATLTIPCSLCGNPAVRLTPPPMEREARSLLKPILKIASLKTGVRIDLPANGATWFDLIAATPADLSQALALTCVFCAQLLEDVTQPAANHAD